MMKRSAIPNLITISRLLLLPFFIAALLEQHFKLAFCLFFVAGFSDGLDGWLARRFNWQSRLGSVLDPLSDKLFVASSYLVLGHLGILPSLLVGLVLVRDVIIVSGVSLCRYMVNDVKYYATLLGKWSAFIQGMVVFLAIYQHAFTPFRAVYFNCLITVTTITTIISGYDYVTIGYRIIQQHRHATHASY